MTSSVRHHSSTPTTPKPPVAVLSYVKDGHPKIVPLRPACLVGALCLGLSLTIGSIGSGAYLYLRDDVVGATLKRQARMQNMYEDRIAALRAQVDLVTSRQLLDQQAVESKVAKLLRKQEELGAREFHVKKAFEVTGSIPTQKSFKLGSLIGSSDSFGAPADTDVLASLEQSLEATERAQIIEIETMRRAANHKVRKLTEILDGQGIDLPKGSSIGGPLIQLKGNRFSEYADALDSELEALGEIRKIAKSLPHGNPTPGQQISSKYGSRRDPFTKRSAMHSGLDFRAPKGTKVISTADGTVIKAGRNGGYGKMVEIEHAGGLTTRYAHLSRISVKVGQKIQHGQLVGKVGSTGRSTGPHLHYEVRRKGRAMNPIHYVRLGKHIKPYL